VVGAVAIACRSAGVPDRPPTVQPGAPGESSKVIKGAPAPPPGYSSADVRFMQGMISHHEQALEMTRLLRSRTSSPDMRLLALRIDISQGDEIKMMRRWLAVRGQKAPEVGGTHQHGAAPMPGMLSADEMTRLAAAKDAAFDRLFLELMIKHHEGALLMVKELLSSDNAAQGSEIFGFAADVEVDQRMEIERMGRMLAAGR
jgi:uncharacterized protein (DUF305 family)